MGLFSARLLCGILVCALTVHGRPQSLTPESSNLIESKASDSPSMQSNHSILVTCQCSSGCSDVGVYFTLMDDRPIGYCGGMYAKNNKKGSRCVTFCNNLDHNQTCSVESVDPDETYRIKGKEYNSVWYNQGYQTQYHSLTCEKKVTPLSSESEGSVDASVDWHGMDHQANDTALVQERGLSLAKVACTTYNGYCYLATTSKCEFKCPWWKVWCTECSSRQIREKKCSGGTHTLIKWGCKAVSWKGIMDVVKDVIWDFFW